MSKWLSVELSLLLLISMVAFAGFVSFNAEDSNDFNEVSGFATACGGTSYGTCPENNQCRQVSRQCVRKSFGRCTKYASVYGCVSVAPPKPTQTPTSTPQCTDSDGGKNYLAKGVTVGVSSQTGKVYEGNDVCGFAGNPYAKEGQLVEHYCEGKYHTNTVISCENGCKDGACLQSSSKLSDFVEALLAGKRVQLRVDSVKGAGVKFVIGAVNDLIYDSAKNELKISFMNPNTGKIETDSSAYDKDRVIKDFGKLIFDSKTRTFRDDGSTPEISLSGVYALDGSLKSTTPKLPEFTEALLAGKPVQLRTDKGGSTGDIGVVYTFLYNPSTGEVTLSMINPETGKLETKSEKNKNREDIINVFSRFIFDSKTRTFRDDRGVSGVYALDGSLKSTTPLIIKEQVKCVFNNSNDQQRCYTSIGEATFECSGINSCVVDVFGIGTKGEKITWKSTCGGYAYTTIDSNNEHAEFKCAAQTPTPTPQPSKPDLSKITGPSNIFIFVSYDIKMAQNLEKEFRSFGYTSQTGSTNFDNLRLGDLTGVLQNANYILFNRDKSKRMIIFSKNTPQADMDRAAELHKYYNTLPNVVTKSYISGDKMPLGPLLELSK